ncbi:MAG: ACP S-malonyltransferase [Gemmatimonadaceae bacterium]|nr:ACP S-malonyltransferase [Gemmatimonadaceae bacterium]
MDIALIFPGQGSQKPGMAQDLAARFPAAADVMARADAALGFPLSALCYGGPADALVATEVAQPALLAHGAAAWAVLADALRPHVRAAAGHSLGEFTAHHAAGTLGLEAAVRLVRTRGEAMRDCGLARPGAMAAILGDTDQPIEAICEAATREAGTVVPANFNSPGQVVISGEIAGVERAMALCKAAGAKRAVPLPVSGAFHSPLMAPARTALEGALRASAMRDPSVPVYANVTAAPVRTADEARALLGEQLTGAVRWTELVRRIAADHPGVIFIECGPGTVLQGLVRKIVPGAEVWPAGTAADVETILSKVA